jgi:hypothetical protein
MAELLILEFEGVGEGDYDKVNQILGIDSVTGEGDWPAGLISHTAGPIEDGWRVIEVWESQEDQKAGMGRLGAALQQAGIDKPPRRAEWSKVKAHHTPRKASSKV